MSLEYGNISATPPPPPQPYQLPPPPSPISYPPPHQLPHSLVGACFICTPDAHITTLHNATSKLMPDFRSDVIIRVT